jgi:hypothetical protein
MDRHNLRLGVLLLSVTVSVMGGDEKSLRGLQGLEVSVEELSDEVERAGLHKTDIQTDIELKLRLAGINVLTKEESLRLPGYPFLYVNVSVQLNHGSATSELASYALNCELHQYVTLARDLSISTDASTWDRGRVGLVGTNNLKKIRDDLRDLIDKFVNAYLSVNPKK